MTAAPVPDPDDEAVCHGCGRRTRGVAARRFFARHVQDCRGSAELRYGDAVRLLGAPE